MMETTAQHTSSQRNEPSSTAPESSLSQTVLSREMGAKIKAYSKQGAQVAGVAFLKVISRTLAWGSVGLLIGLAGWLLSYFTGALDHPAQFWVYVQWSLLPLYVVVAAIACGHAGFMRGWGRTTLYIGIEKGLLAFTLDKMLQMVVSVLKRSDKLKDGMERSQHMLEELPLQRWEEVLKAATDKYLAQPDSQGGALAGLKGWLFKKMRKFTVKRIEKYLLHIVRQEAADNKGGGISLARVQELAFRKAEDYFADLVESMMNKTLLMGMGISIGAIGITPLVLWLLRLFA